MPNTYDPKFEEIRIRLSLASLDVATRTELSVFQANTDASARALFIDAMASDGTRVPYKTEIDANGGTIVRSYQRRGFGIRIAILAGSVDANANLSLAYLSARNETSAKKIRYEVELNGFPKELLKELPQIGELDARSLHGIKVLLLTTLPEYIRTAEPERPPLGLGEYIEPSAPPPTVDPLSAVNFAMNHLARRQGLTETLSKIGSMSPAAKDVVSDVVRQVFQSYGAADAPDQSAPPDAVKRAQAWLEQAEG